jgi:glutamate synthase (ferredoxin)
MPTRRVAPPKAILADWAGYLPQFWQVVPPSEKDTAQASAGAEKVAAV